MVFLKISYMNQWFKLIYLEHRRFDSFLDRSVFTN